jgi:hypothetical protein
VETVWECELKARALPVLEDRLRTLLAETAPRP